MKKIVSLGFDEARAEGKAQEKLALVQILGLGCYMSVGLPSP